MMPRLAQREIALAGIALLAGVIALALVRGRSDSAETLPQPVGSWYQAVAAVRQSGGLGEPTACGQTLRADAEGVSNPVLPCGAKIYLSFRGRRALTQVIDRGPKAPGREFELTRPLADMLGFDGVRRIRWAYAAPVR
jgi:hypothetical protein